MENDLKKNEIITTEIKVDLPSMHSGLDPLFHACPRMYITDVLNMPEVDAGIFRYLGHLVVTVDVMGVVAKVYVHEKVIVYAVDDSTGVISVSCWRNQCDDTHLEPFNHLSASFMGSALHLKLLEVRSRQQILEGCKLGTLLHVRGNVSSYNGLREIKASHCAVVRDPKAEMERMLEMPALYKQFYDCPVRLPTPLASELGLVESAAEAEAVIDEAKTRRTLVEAILNHINLDRLESVAVELLTADLRLAALASKSKDTNIWNRALVELAAKGHLFEHAINAGEYRVVKNDAALRLSALKIIRQSSSCQQDGCHFLDVFAELRKLVSYCKISKSALEQCLTCLERRSDIISCSDRRYVAVS